MAKYYVQDTHKTGLIVDRPSKFAAAVAFVEYYQGKPEVDLGPSIVVDERGFNQDSFDTNSVFNTSEVMTSAQGPPHN